MTHPNSRQNLTPFKKGHNKPGPGHPKGKTLTTILKSLIKQKLNQKNPFTKKEESLEISTWLNLSLLAEGLTGKNKVKALQMIYDRIDGKLAQEIIGDFDIKNFDVTKLSKEELERIAGHTQCLKEDE